MVGRLTQTLTAAALSMCLAGTAAIAAQSAPPLSALGIDPSGITVSGISSGAFLAHQIHIAHASMIQGAGLIAGGPYYCAGSGYPFTVLRATTVCATLGSFGPFIGPPEVGPLLEEIAARAEADDIDDPANLRSDRVYLFSGEQDDIVPTSVVEAVADLYRPWIADAGLILHREREAPHAMITDGFGTACDDQASPYIANCGFDLAGAILNHLYGVLPSGTPQKSGEVLSFDQTAILATTSGHTATAATIGMAETGFVYVPEACQNGGCRLHVALHGCLQSAKRIGDAFVIGAGYNRWADAGRIVILYPQASAEVEDLGLIDLPWPNPAGCWDWWGFAGEPYHTRSAPQIRAIKSMIDRLMDSTPGQ